MAWEELASVYEQLHECAFQIEDIARAKERQRIARDLHDSLGHALTALNIQLQTALKLWKLDPAKAECFLLQAQRLGTTAMKEVRESVCSIRATAKVNQPLEPLIESLVEDFRQVSDVSISTCINLNLSAVLPCEVSTALYRIVQESLTNIRKHAAATAVQIKINTIPCGVQLVVADNGKGFKTDTLSKGFGLQGMAERVAALGGQFDIYTEPEKGCEIKVELPFQQQAPVQKSPDFAANVSPLKVAEPREHLVLYGKQSLQNIETKPKKSSQMGVELPFQQQQIPMQSQLDRAANDVTITIIKSVKRLVLSSDRSVQLEEILTEYVGSIAPTLLQKVTEQIPNCQELVTKLLFYIPHYQRSEFEQRLSFLFDSSPSPEETTQEDWAKEQEAEKKPSPSPLPFTPYPNFSKNSKVPRFQFSIETAEEMRCEMGVEQPSQQQALVQEPPDFAANVSTLEVAEPVERLVLSSEQLLQLEKVLTEYIGVTIAPMLLQEVIQQTTSCQELVAELLLYVCASQRTEFEQQLSFLFDSSPSVEETTQEDCSNFSSQTINESFIRQCEEQLIDLIGPFAPLLIKETLKSSPGISRSELIEAIATKIPDAQLAVEFRQALSNQPDTETKQELLSYIPAVQQTEFEERVAFLCNPVPNELKTAKEHLSALRYQSIDESFLQQCEQQLIDLVGPFALLLIEETLESVPGISRPELVETIAAKIPDAQVAAEFQQRMEF